MVSKNIKKIYFFTVLYLGKTDMVLGKRRLFSIGNGAEIRPLEMGRKSSAVITIWALIIRQIVLINKSQHILFIMASLSFVS